MSRSLPARFAHAVPDSRAEGWGRLLRLGPNRADLLTRFNLEKGDRLVMEFEAFGEAFERVRARVVSAQRDADGYVVARLSFEAPLAQVRLGRVLRDALSRS
ncbi:MAG: hypothetical protein HY078_09810 [Elusimicrobia bacterium]|nr:hypothetical protein [Elusimicrobiota bacterium]